jgi:hypothetical protein
MILTRPARADDVARLHPEVAGVSYRAWVAELDGKPAGVIGLALTRPRACLFCGFDETLRPHIGSPTVLRLLKKVETMFKARGLPVFTIRDRNEPKAQALLDRLGFEYVGDVDGDAVYEWSA